MRIVFLCSGGGGNLRFLHAMGRRHAPLDLKIAGVFGDRPGPALEYAGRHSMVNGSARFDGSDDEVICTRIDQCRPDVIVTTIHRILSPRIVDRYRGSLVNLHYSLLPMFGGLIGMDPVRKAIEAGCRFVGTTVHHVVEAVDAGPVISQSVVRVMDDEPFESLANRVFQSGCVNLLNGIQLVSGWAPAPWDHSEGIPPSPCTMSSHGVEFGEDLWNEVRG